MKTLLLMLVLVAASSGLAASETEGLFVAGDERAAPKQEFKDGELILRFKAVRLQLTRAVFRFDTEDKKRYWLEIDIGKEVPRNPDPGDFYVFRIEGKDYGGFSTRGQLPEGGYRWALGITDPVAGRALLAKIGKVYRLSGSQVKDQTQGVQTGAGGR